MAHDVPVFSDGDVFTDIDSFSAARRCIKIATVKICAELVVHLNGVKLCLRAGAYRKCVAIGGNGCFDVGIYVVKFKICVRDFSLDNDKVCLRLSIEVCVDFGWFDKCEKLLSTKVCASLPTTQAIDRIRDLSTHEQVSHLQLISAATEDDDPATDLNMFED